MKKLKLLALFLVLAVVMSACSAPASEGDLMAGIKAEKPELELNTIQKNLAWSSMLQFNSYLLRQVAGEAPEETNILIAPMSIANALTMTGMGAKGDTFTQLENALTITYDEYPDLTQHSWIGLDKLRDYLSGFELPSSKETKLRQANSIWFRDGAIDVEPDFLQQSADYFGAGAFARPFDEGTLEEINSWVSGKTDGMIPQLLSELKPEALMCLINATSFDGKWENPYTDGQVTESTFTRTDRTKAPVDMMVSEDGIYVGESHTEGFMKYYKGGDYAFVALRPVKEYEERWPLTQLYSFYSDITKISSDLLPKAVKENKPVISGLPRFEAEYSVELSSALLGMGINDAFDPDAADFSGIGTAADGGNLYISQVIHKAKIQLDEEGTKAAAATAVVMAEGAAAPDEDPIPEVIMDSPFLYMIVETDSYLPIFIGLMYDPAA